MSTNLNMNKVAAAIVLAGLIGMVAGKATEFLYDGGPQHAGGHHDEKRGYSIEVTEVEAGAGGAAAPAGPADISALYPTADQEAGGTYFAKKCSVCHSIDKGGANKVGPNLYGILGHKVATKEGFSYSKAMLSHSDRTWNWEEMNGFQWVPKKWVPGTIMAYAGTPKDQERANLIVYLNSQSDSPLALPPVTTPAETPPEDAAAADAKEETPAEAEPVAAEAPAAQ